jgi:hypothetical protein
MPTGIVLAYSVPDGVQVLVDGHPESAGFGITRTPTIIHDVYAGIRAITFTLPGYKDVTIYVDVPQNGYSTITAIMHPGTT